MERHPELQLLIDEAAIRRLLALYPRALDRHDRDLLKSLFHDDAIDDHGPFNESAEGFVDFMRAGDVPGYHWMHHNGTQIIEIEGTPPRRPIRWPFTDGPTGRAGGAIGKSSFGSGTSTEWRSATVSGASPTGGSCTPLSCPHGVPGVSQARRHTLPGRAA
jgi:SnoaL-like domain